jgi:hypothetical protein
MDLLRAFARLHSIKKLWSGLLDPNPLGGKGILY